jgi:hypothetical protein
MHYGHLFKTKCAFAVVVNNIGRRLFEKGAGKQNEKETFPAIASLATNLFAWHAALPLSLTPNRIVFPGQFKLQYVILTIVSCHQVLTTVA